MEGPFSLSRRRFIAWVGAGAAAGAGGWAGLAATGDGDAVGRAADLLFSGAHRGPEREVRTLHFALGRAEEFVTGLHLCVGGTRADLVPHDDRSRRRLAIRNPVAARTDLSQFTHSAPQINVPTNAAARGDPLRHGSGHRPRGDRRRRAPAPHVGDAARRPRRRQPGDPPRPVRPAPHGAHARDFSRGRPRDAPRGVGAGGPRRPGHLHRPEDGVQTPRDHQHGPGVGGHHAAARERDAAPRRAGDGRADPPRQRGHLRPAPPPEERDGRAADDGVGGPAGTRLVVPTVHAGRHRVQEPADPHRLDVGVAPNDRPDDLGGDQPGAGHAHPRKQVLGAGHRHRPHDAAGDAPRPAAARYHDHHRAARS